MEKQYAELVKRAENAVSSVKDAELKRVAFERVLNDLLESAADPAEGQSSSPPRKQTKKPAAKSSPKTRRGPMAYVEEIVEDGFFKKPKTIAAVKAELENRGHHIPLTSLSGPMQKLCQRRVLRRQKPDGKTYSYSNW